MDWTLLPKKSLHATKPVAFYILGAKKRSKRSILDLQVAVSSGAVFLSTFPCIGTGKRQVEHCSWSTIYLRSPAVFDPLSCYSAGKRRPQEETEANSMCCTEGREHPMFAFCLACVFIRGGSCPTIQKSKLRTEWRKVTQRYRETSVKDSEANGARFYIL